LRDWHQQGRAARLRAVFRRAMFLIQQEKKRGQSYAAPQHAATTTPVNPAFSTGDGTFGLLVTAAPAV